MRVEKVNMLGYIKFFLQCVIELGNGKKLYENKKHIKLKII